MSRGFFTQYLGFGQGGLFSGERGNLGIKVGRAFSIIGDPSQGVLRLLGAQRFFPSAICYLCLRLKVCLPGVVRVSIKVIVVQGGVERNFQGRIPAATICSGSGQGVWVLGVGFDLNSQRPRCFRMALMTSRSSMKLIIRRLPLNFGRLEDRPHRFFL